MGRVEKEVEKTLAFGEGCAKERNLFHLLSPVARRCEKYLLNSIRADK